MPNAYSIRFWQERVRRFEAELREANAGNSRRERAEIEAANKEPRNNRQKRKKPT